MALIVRFPNNIELQTMGDDRTLHLQCEKHVEFVIWTPFYGIHVFDELLPALLLHIFLHIANGIFNIRHRRRLGRLLACTLPRFLGSLGSPSVTILIAV